MPQAIHRMIVLILAMYNIIMFCIIVCYVSIECVHNTNFTASILLNSDECCFLETDYDNYMILAWSHSSVYNVNIFITWCYTYKI